MYVGSAESEEYDQVLDSVLVGPVPAGRHMFVFQVMSSLVNIVCIISFNSVYGYNINVITVIPKKV